MKPHRLFRIVPVLLALASLLLAACARTPQAAAPTALVTPSALPTAAIIATSLPTASAVVPRELPTLATPITMPTATFAPPPTPTTQPSSAGGLPFPLKTQQLEFGVAAHLFYTERDTPLSAAKNANFGWVRQQIHWSDQEGPAENYAWGELDTIVADVNAHGLKLLISIVSSPSFYTNGGTGMPVNPRNMGNFVEALATHYQGKVQAIEIWNEQNLAHENGGQVSINDAGHYVELLKEAYTRIKAVDPTIYVIAGPPSSTAVTSPAIAVDDMTYYKAMYSYQNGIIRNYCDAQAVHPGGSANPPDTLWPDAPSQAQGWTNDRTFYFRHIEDVRALMVQYGMADHPIWITEFGWATANSTPGFEFGNQISLDTQANFIVEAMKRTKEQYPWVGAMFLWNLNFAPLKAQEGQSSNEQASFGILNPDYSPRPSYYAIQQYIASLGTQ